MLIPAQGNTADNYLVFEYVDFGPQVMAWETLGGQWWQWDTDAHSEPIHAQAIHVVVYHETPIKQIKDRFPVIKEKQQDYRYLEALESLRYLNRHIAELDTLADSWSLELKQRLMDTRSRIKLKFGIG
jgi:hypothetical protein